MDEEPVKGGQHGRDGVDVGREEEGGLGLAHGHDAFGLQRSEPSRWLAGSQRSPDLAEDVEGELVTRVRERAVALGVRRHQAAAGIDSRESDARRATVDPERLRRYADVGVPVGHDLRTEERPVGTGLHPARDVEPLDQDRAVESVLARGSAHHDAGTERGGGTGSDSPLTVTRQVLDGVVGGGGAAGEELLGDITVRLEVERYRRYRLGDPSGRTGHAEHGAPAVISVGHRWTFSSVLHSGVLAPQCRQYGAHVGPGRCHRDR